MNVLIDNFLQYLKLELNRSSNTVEAYGRDLRELQSFLAGLSEDGHVEVSRVHQSDIRAWLLELSERGDGPRTLRRKVQSVRAFFKWLRRRRLVLDNPAAEVELAKLPRRLPTVVREATMNTLLDEPVATGDADDVRDRLIVMMLYETGMRRAELITLLDKNVDTAAGTLKVRGKRDKDRIIPFGDELRDAIERYRELRPVPQQGTFFTRADGEPLYPSLVYRVVNRSLAEAGVTGKRSPHVLRHSFATAMLNHGAGINSVKELLGHASLAATQVYTHVTFSELKHNYELAHPRALKD